MTDTIEDAWDSERYKQLSGLPQKRFLLFFLFSLLASRIPVAIAMRYTRDRFAGSVSPISFRFSWPTPRDKHFEERK
jgi:Na+-transporting NADH:ubiquinone oxidoreductase subunit NqrB